MVPPPASRRRSADSLGGARHRRPDRQRGPGLPRSPAAPDWLAELGGYRPCGPGELPPGFGSGWRYAAPLIHMPTYLRYLQARFERAGGTLGGWRRWPPGRAAREAGAPVVVNCSGAHARRLAGDPAVTPVRGQTVVTSTRA